MLCVVTSYFIISFINKEIMSFLAHERDEHKGAEELKAAFGQKEKTRAWKSKIKQLVMERCTDNDG